MDERARKLLRTGQTYLPWLPDAKALAQRWTRQACRRPFEEDFRALPLLGLPPGGTYVDIGANRGQSIDAMRLHAPKAVIHAFEPNQMLANRLTRRFQRCAGVIVHDVAIGEVRGTFALHVPIYRGYVFDGLASLDEPSARDWLTDTIYQFDRSRLQVEVSACSVERLDDFGLAPAFIKIDVQGFEHQALLGARQTLERHRPALLIESPGAAVTAYLAALGYESYQYIRGSLVQGEHGLMNTFFVSPDQKSPGPSS